MILSKKYIYVLKDPSTNEVRYVGQTTRPKNRIAAHLAEGRYIPVKNKDKVDWINSLKAKNEIPKFEIVDECELDVANLYENMYIQKYLKNGHNLLNSVVNNRFSQKQKDRLRESQPHQKQVIQFDLNGEYLTTWQNITYAAKELGLQRELISKCCRGLRKTTGGYIFNYGLKQAYAENR
jgi:hypothetical protein